MAVGETNGQTADNNSVELSVPAGFRALLDRLGVSVAFSSYQGSGLYLVGRGPSGGLHVHQTAMPRPMGLFSDGGKRLCMAVGTEVLRLDNVLEPHERANGHFDACFLVRESRGFGRKSGRPAAPRGAVLTSMAAGLLAAAAPATAVAQEVVAPPGTVTVTSSGDISTREVGATWIEVRSVQGPSATVTSQGNISALGNGAPGISAYA